jgi:hypothetical protein
MWTNQFFEFSIIDSIARNYEANDIFMMLDSDCIFNGRLDQLFQLCKERGCITYALDIPEKEMINGITRSQMKEVFENILNDRIDTVPVYHAGEFFMADLNIIRKFSEQFRQIWPTLLSFHHQGKPKLVEEAHVLSFLYYINSFQGGEANHFIKRIWTDPTNFRNVSETDKELAIWHVPAEKSSG